MVKGDAGRFIVTGIQQVDGHVESRAEAGMQRVHTFAGQCGGGGRHETAMVDNHGMADGVDATTSRTSGQLGELPGVSPTCPVPSYFSSFSTTTQRAGILIPKASVSVANTTLTRPSSNKRSTI